MIIGCDYHPSWQQICWLDKGTGETGEQKLEHASREAEKFCRQLPGPALIGMESTGNCQWFVEMVTQLGHELWVGDAAKIRASEVRQQKHDRRDTFGSLSAGASATGKMRKRAEMRGVRRGGLRRVRWRATNGKKQQIPHRRSQTTRPGSG